MSPFSDDFIVHRRRGTAYHAGVTLVGSTSGGGGSSGYPEPTPGALTVGSGKTFSTIQAAVNAVTNGAGGIIEVYPGTYSDTRTVTPHSSAPRTTVVDVNKSGNSSNRLIIRGMGPSTILNGLNSTNEAFTINQRQYVTIEFLEMTNFRLTGGLSDNGQYGIVSMCNFGGSFTGNNTVQDCNFHDSVCPTDTTDFACVNVTQSNATIRRNYMRFNTAGGTQQQGSGVRGSASTGHIIDQNTIEWCHQGVYFSQACHDMFYTRNYVISPYLSGLWSRASLRTTMYGNVVEHAPGAPRTGTHGAYFMNDNVDSNPTDGDWLNENHYCAHNIAIGTGILFYIYANMGIQCVNNIALNCGSSFYVNESFSNKGHSFRYTLSHNVPNLYTADGSNGGNNPVWPGTYVSNPLSGNPLIQGTGAKASPYFRVVAGSPAIGAGDPAVLKMLDYDGVLVGSSPTVGAFQTLGS
jgi:hypothetical protein